MTDRDPPAPDDSDDESGLTGMLGRAGAAALRPVRAVAHAGKDALNDEAERALDGVMAGPLPEAVGRSLVEHRVVERVVTSALQAKQAKPGTGGPSVDSEQLEQALRDALANPALERMLKETISSRLTGELADQIVHSPVFRNTMKEVLASPEVRQAIQQQTSGFGADIAAAARRKGRGADTSLESKIRRRPSDAGRQRYGGFATRGVAFAVDVLLADLIYLVGGAMIGLVTSIFGELKPTWLAATLAVIGGVLVITTYFVFFWSTTGQTPGMRLMRLRVQRAGDAPSVWRSLVRLVGLQLAIIPCFAGFLPILFDPQRRDLPDYLAGTTVISEPEPGTEPELAAELEPVAVAPSG